MKKRKKVKKKVKAKKKISKKNKKPVKKAKKKVVKGKKEKAASAKAKAEKKPSLPAGISAEEMGVVTHYFPHVEAAVIKMTRGPLSAGDNIIIKGHTTDFQDTADSMQLDHVSITSASRGQEIGMRVKSKVREGDIVYKLVG